MTDRDRLDEMLRSLVVYINELQRLRKTDEAKFLASRDMIGNAKYQFIIAIECCVDIANHVIAAERLRTPTDYADTFKSLEEARVLDEKTAQALRQAARFRNRLTHRYWDVDDGLVHRFLLEDLHHFDDFARQIGKIS
jgi:uncharacterized protein YutE (UPF0331/DUF86 family)